MSELKEGVDYRFVFPENANLFAVSLELLTGKYQGVIFQYGKVSVQEDKENDQAFLKFEYDIISDNGVDVSDSHEFKEHIGNILVGIISKQMVKTDSGIEDMEIIEE